MGGDAPSFYKQMVCRVNKLKFFITDTCVYFCSVKRAYIHISGRTPSKDKALCTVAYDFIKESEAFYFVFSLIAFLDAAF